MNRIISLLAISCFFVSCNENFHITAEEVLMLNISSIADQLIDEDESTGEIIFSVPEGIDCLDDISVETGNSSIIEASDIVFGIDGENCTVTLNPKANAHGGPVEITLTISNGEVSNSTSFDLRVTPVIDPFTIIGPVTTGETVSVDDYGPDFSSASSHQWLSDGVPIPGATGTTFDITSAEEGTTITLELDGARNSENSLVTIYFPVFDQENRALIISNVNVNGVPVSFINLFTNMFVADEGNGPLLTDQGNGSLLYHNSTNENINKRVYSTLTVVDPGDYLEVTVPDNPNFTGHSFGLSAAPLSGAVPRNAPNRILTDRGATRTRTYNLRIDNVSVLNIGIRFSNAATYRFTRTITGFEVTRNGNVIYPIP